jgi:hypothetical protein
MTKNKPRNLIFLNSVGGTLLISSLLWLSGKALAAPNPETSTIKVAQFPGGLGGIVPPLNSPNRPNPAGRGVGVLRDVLDATTRTTPVTPSSSPANPEGLGTSPYREALPPAPSGITPYREASPSTPSGISPYRDSAPTPSGGVSPFRDSVSPAGEK